MSKTVSNGSEEFARSRRRGIVVLCAVAALLAMAVVFTANAQSDATPTVTFLPQGSDDKGTLPPVTISLSEEAAGAPDVVNKTYTIKSPGGKTTKTVTGWSLGQLLAKSGIGLTPYPFLEVRRPDGSFVALNTNQATSSRAFDDGPLVVYVEDGTVKFLRPLGKDDSDLNSTDAFEAPAGDLGVRLRKTAPISVTVSPKAKKVKVGAKVTMRGAAHGGAAGDELVYSWSSAPLSFFDTGRSITYTFKKAGTFPFLLKVTSSSAIGNEGNGVVTITVGDPKKSKKDRKGGGTNKDDGAPDSGASDGSSGTGTGTGYGGSTDYGYTDPGTSSPVTPAPVTPQTTPPPKTETTPKPETTPKQTVPATSGETQVEGTVLTGLSLAAASVPPPSGGAASPSDTAPAKDVAAREGTPKDPSDPSGGLHIPAGVWMLLLLVLLLIGGFWQDAYRAVAPRTIPRIP